MEKYKLKWNEDYKSESYHARIKRGLKPHREKCICKLCLEWEGFFEVKQR